MSNRRQVEMREIEAGLVESVEKFGMGLSKSAKEMAHLRVEKGEAVIPAGIYCYDQNGNCPYWDKAANRPEQDNGFCWLLGKGDWDDGVGELWDQCKCCGVNEGMDA